MNRFFDRSIEFLIDRKNDEIDLFQHFREILMMDSKNLGRKHFPIKIIESKNILILKILRSKDYSTYKKLRDVQQERKETIFCK